MRPLAISLNSIGPLHFDLPTKDGWRFRGKICVSDRRWNCDGLRTSLLPPVSVSRLTCSVVHGIISFTASRWTQVNVLETCIHHLPVLQCFAVRPRCVTRTSWHVTEVRCPCSHNPGSSPRPAPGLSQSEQDLGILESSEPLWLCRSLVSLGTSAAPANMACLLWTCRVFFAVIPGPSSDLVMFVVQCCLGLKHCPAA